MGGREVRRTDAAYRESLRSLVNVDDFVGEVAATVPENTVLIFWTDNGTHTGYHRLPYGKRTPYEEDIRFPMIVRGPGVEPGSTERLVGNHDLAPTVADLVGAEAPSADGRSIVPLLSGDVPWRDALLTFNVRSPDAPAWEAVRTENATYVEYESGERELYDLVEDPHQIENILHKPTPEAEEKAQGLSVRLDELRGCVGDSCRAAEAP